MIVGGSRFGLFMGANYKYYAFSLNYNEYIFSDRDVTLIASISILIAAIVRFLISSRFFYVF